MTTKDSNETNHELKDEIEKLHHINQLILDSVAEGIYGIDLHAKVIFWNKAAEALTGYDLVELENNNLHDLIHHTNPRGEHVPVCECPVYHALNSGQSLFVKDDLFWRKDGSSFPVEYTVKPMMEKDKYVGSVITFRDMTEKVQAEQIMLQQDKLTMVGQMAAGIVHEIRNPITTLKGFLKLLRSNGSKEQYFEIMDSEFDRIETIIQELLTFSKPQSSQYVVQDLGELVRQAVMLMEPHAVMMGVSLDLDVGCAVKISCIEHQLMQVFINLIKNAIEAMEESGGRIHLDLSIQNREAVVLVKDDGPGMERDELEKLGQPFYSTKEKGTGLGLMMVNNIIRNNHGGRIQVESKRNEGTTFVIRLPIEDAQGR